ncbi:hypothetical protein ACLB2K_040524 [Fragaria x ananassa]
MSYASHVIHHSRKTELLKKTIKKFYTESPKDANCIARIVNKKHFQRVQNLLEEPLVEASIVHGGSLDEEKLFIEPIVLLNPPLDSAIMNEEIFGPLLPVITLKNIQESIEVINTRPKPLTITSPIMSPPATSSIFGFGFGLCCVSEQGL